MLVIINSSIILSATFFGTPCRQVLQTKLQNNKRVFPYKVAKSMIWCLKVIDIFHRQLIVGLSQDLQTCWIFPETFVSWEKKRLIIFEMGSRPISYASSSPSSSLPSPSSPSSSPSSCSPRSSARIQPGDLLGNTGRRGGPREKGFLPRSISSLSDVGNW